MRPMRRGVCPSLAAPTPTGDGLLVRLNPMDRHLSGAALAGLAAAAARFGNGLVEITARGSLQIRGLTSATLPRLAAAVHDLGIALATGVAVETGPLAGLDATEIDDPRPLAAGLRRALDGTGIGRRLGPKASVAVDGGGSLHLGGLPADVRLEALGGGRWGCGATIPLDPVGHVVDWLAAIAADGRRSPRTTAPAAEPIGRHRLHGDRLAVGVGLPFGQVPAAALAGLTGSEAREFRLSPGRAILAVGLCSDAAADWAGRAKAAGFITDPRDPRRSIAACPGCPACAAGEIPARAMAEEIAARNPALLDGSMTLHVSGCAKGCAHPRPTMLSLVGVDRVCAVALDGSPMGRLAPSAAIGVLTRLADLVAQERATGETAADCLTRLGQGPIARLLRDEVHV